MFSRIVGAAALCALTLVQTTSSFAANKKLDFKLHNKTGFVISELYVGPTTVEEWGKDILEQEVLGDGETAAISFHPKADETKWDLKIVDEDGTSYEWIGYDLSEITDMTLYYKDGETTAVTKNGAEEENEE